MTYEGYTNDAIAVYLIHAAKLVRQVVFSCSSAFNYSFELTSHQDTVNPGKYAA